MKNSVFIFVKYMLSRNYVTFFRLSRGSSRPWLCRSDAGEFKPITRRLTCAAAINAQRTVATTPSPSGMFAHIHNDFFIGNCNEDAH
jgi:hypothetical protein